MRKDPYEILQVSPSAEPEIIAAAYRRLAAKYHPDVNTSPGAKERMQEFNWAYDVLRDPTKRAEYNRSRKQTRPPPRPKYSAPPKSAPSGERQHSTRSDPAPSRTPSPQPNLKRRLSWLVALAIIVPIVVGLVSTVSRTSPRVATPTVEPSPIATVPPGPTEQVLFRDSKAIKDIFEENPLFICSITSERWECYQDITQSGRWYLRYYSGNDGDNEIYESEYIDFGGLDRDAVIKVVAGTIAIIHDESISNSILDWVVGEVINHASNENAGVIPYEVNGIFIFLSLTNNSMSFSICHGDWCTRNQSVQSPATSTPIVNKTTIGNLSFDLPPGWCHIDAIHISSFCPYFTKQPLATIEFNEMNSGTEGQRDAIVDFIKEFENAGFQVLNFSYIPDTEISSVAGEPFTMAYAEMVHPDYDFPPSPDLFVSFDHKGKNYLLWGYLNQSNTESDFEYLYEIMLGLLEGISFVK